MTSVVHKFMFNRVILIIINCNVGKVELSEYAISIIPFFSDDQRSNKNILSCSSYQVQILGKDESNSSAVQHWNSN